MTEPTPQTRAPRRGRPGYDQETVIRRATELFNQQGYEGTSMNDLAKELGLTKSALYHHLPSKEHILGLALEEALTELTSAVERARATGTDSSAYERVRHLVQESVKVLVAHQPAVTLLLRVRGNSELELAALKRRRWIDDEVAAIVQEAIDEGSLRGDVDPALVSRLLFGMVNSLIEWHRPNGDVDAETLATAIATIAFDGLKR
ncbi:transcriptional regulator, TetR family [Nocardioides sp. YR527]|uniref:TetR/AcrR family transcriptional regulator n=1 Tax=Nocardioides sp. YR527 TaxID=1881028 RepID=UPI00088035F7|nr:TetR/AcrR family transcriptional regulator [Nocardioides sp. YR527]SDK56628.1 transcriptional regulator, TetR family [Nocardioides sp. YR527]